MAYPNDGDPRDYLLLETLRSEMEQISEPDYFHNVDHARLMDTFLIPAQDAVTRIYIIPTSDSPSDPLLTCPITERVMGVDIVGVLSIVPGSEGWKRHAYQLKSDIFVAVSTSAAIDALIAREVSTCVASHVFEQGESSLAIVDLSWRFIYRHTYLNPTTL